MDNLYWVKVHRQIRECGIWDTDEPFDRRSAWLDLIMEAHTKPKDVPWKGHVINVKRGDVYTSIRSLAQRWHWSTGKVTRFLIILEKLGMVKRHKDVKCVTLLTIVNYGKFQDKRNTDEDADETQTKRRRNKDGVLLKNNKNKYIKKKEEAESLIEEAPASEEDDENYVQDPSTMWCTDEEWEAGEEIL